MPDFELRFIEAKERSERCQSPGGGPMLTQQHFTEEVDINTIVSRFGLTGEIPRRMEGVYGDFSGISDYDSALETIRRTEERFMTLPAELRERFDNDPGALVRFVTERPESEVMSVFGAAPVESAPAQVVSEDVKPPQ